SARLACPGLLTTKWILPRPALVSALSAEMLTRASANVRARAARTPGRDLRLRVSWAALAIGSPPRLGGLGHCAYRIKPAPWIGLAARTPIGHQKQIGHLRGPGSGRSVLVGRQGLEPWTR